MRLLKANLCCGFVYVLLLLASSSHSQSILNSSPTDGEKQQILDLHKSVREAAETGLNIVWDNELETLAKTNVVNIGNTCIMQHTTLESNAQNVYSYPSNRTSSIYEGVHDWKMELDKYNKKYFNRSTDIYNELKANTPAGRLRYINDVKRTVDGDAEALKQYGHVLIMADDKYLRVGCASAYNPKCNINGTPFFNLVFCEYGTADLLIKNARVEGGSMPQKPATDFVQAAPKAVSQVEEVIRPTPPAALIPDSKPQTAVKATSNVPEKKIVSDARSEKTYANPTIISDPYKAEYKLSAPCIRNRKT